MRRIIFPAAFAALLTALPAAARLETFTVDPNHTFPAFEIGHFGYSFQRGRFNKTTGKLTLDTAAKLSSADIDTGSVSTGHAKLEAATIRRSDFGIKTFLPAVADDVMLRINVEAIKD